ncbi:MAG: hypothetical protein CL610_15550 [Anaerolineaceae bacterium]|nr:hypothetical protein [Anaerolineaceae bacterium]
MKQLSKTTLVVIVILATGLVSGVLATSAQGPDNSPCGFDDMFGGMMGRGMNDLNLPEACAQQGVFGMGMMGGMMGRMNGMMMHNMMGFDQSTMRFGPGTGMMGAWTPSSDLAPEDDALTLEEAVGVAQAYIDTWESEQPLELAEVMQFSKHFYAQAREAETGQGAFEFLIDPQTGVVVGELGPNMMWNLRYGMMTRSMGLFRSTESGNDMPVSSAQATELAQLYLDEVLPETQASDEADAFYGYYTLHVLQDGEIIGMLSVNGYNEQVWLHHWHGDFVDVTAHEA